MTVNSLNFSRLLGLAVFLALLVIVLGSYTRLSNAGLGCPDWPGCYGQLSVPDKVVGGEYQRPLESGKAWKEMIHRYVAGSLGLLVLLILFMAVKGRNRINQSIGLPILSSCVVIFQALLGMWTVTLLLSPLIVSSHLLGGLTTLSLLWWMLLNQKQNNFAVFKSSVAFKVASIIALVFLFFQILLGGWTSTNYAALACGVDFPTCASQWWPEMDFENGFDISHKTGVNYEFGTLDSPARMAIQFSHRVGALIVFVYLSLFAMKLYKKNRQLSLILSFLLFMQVSLGIMNVILALPLFVAVLHTMTATLLLLTMLVINHRVFATEIV